MWLFHFSHLTWFELVMTRLTCFQCLLRVPVLTIACFSGSKFYSSHKCLVQQTSQMRNPHSNPICTPKSFSSRPEWSLYSGDSIMNVINFYSSRIRWPHVTKQKNRLPNSKLNRKYQNTWTKPCPFSRLFRAIFPRNVLKLHSVLLKCFWRVSRWIKHGWTKSHRSATNIWRLKYVSWVFPGC